ncbi:Glutamine-dependent NAD(+) synthetase [Schistosoma japonicum]|nr:Glutamine-dependent NAD(+) synthetase [Schistosoma japonicum]KAH8875846.1 Glutamine-dependent NAD(+) synthetase [Schistosoma japonicum]KAH8875847.1 Glutamine-dependent NAD(+) synthetase [Schistosoma japonicum]
MSSDAMQISLVSDKFTVALCVLNQWALDFTGNTKRVIESIKTAKRLGAKYRVGPELEISSYGCEDHFHELDTYTHSWQCIAKILEETSRNVDMQDIVCDIGMPILLGGVAYNCRTVLLNGTVLLIRPKLVLADEGLHRESRWFTPWPHHQRTIDFELPEIIRKVAKNSQSVAAFGDAILRFSGDGYSEYVQIGLETCEELWTGTPPHINMYAAGVDAVLNASASHHELRKLSRRVELIKSASRANGGGLYVYTNLRGCDSGRACYDGCALAAVSGQLIYMGKQFGFEDVSVETVTVCLNSLRSKRIASRCFGRAAAANAAAKVDMFGVAHSCYPVVKVDFNLCHNDHWSNQPLPPYTDVHTLSPSEEISCGPALWLWDNLRRSKSSGFFLCLSGGLDSAAVACIVFSLCNQIFQAIKQGNVSVAHDLRTILNESKEYIPTSDRELCSRLLTTCFMSSENSSTHTRLRANRLAKVIGSNHLESNITSVVNEFIHMASKSLNLSQPPRYTIHGGSSKESLALQNIQARSRMVSAYLLAQLIPWQSDLPSNLLVLSSANLDEGLRGYLTKYDCSSADLNPIGSISKADLRLFVAHCAQTFPIHMDSENGIEFSEVLLEILYAHPTAELIPLQSNGEISQTDECEMGLTYDELSLFGRLRKTSNCGPYSMLESLLDGSWILIKKIIPDSCFQEDGKPNARLAQYLGEKVKIFFRFYAINRHKATILPPAYHTEAYSADDNRFDFRPYLYPSDWNWQFTCLDLLVEKWMKRFK